MGNELKDKIGSSKIIWGIIKVGLCMCKKQFLPIKLPCNLGSKEQDSKVVADIIYCKLYLKLKWAWLFLTLFCKWSRKIWKCRYLSKKDILLLKKDHKVSVRTVKHLRLKTVFVCSVSLIWEDPDLQCGLQLRCCQ